jgi:uncharacterized membrane protein
MNEEPTTVAPGDRQSDQALQPATTVTNVVYVLQAASFLIGITFIVGVIVNYVTRKDVQGTWLESHYRWQIRTFWFGLLWTVIGVVGAFVLVGYLVLVANAVWIIYRIVRGWLRLNDGLEMYASG